MLKRLTKNPKITTWCTINIRRFACPPMLPTRRPPAWHRRRRCQPPLPPLRTQLSRSPSARGMLRLCHLQTTANRPPCWASDPMLKPDSARRVSNTAQSVGAERRRGSSKEMSESPATHRPRTEPKTSSSQPPIPRGKSHCLAGVYSGTVCSLCQGARSPLFELCSPLSCWAGERLSSWEYVLQAVPFGQQSCDKASAILTIVARLRKITTPGGNFSTRCLPGLRGLAPSSRLSPGKSGEVSVASLSYSAHIRVYSIVLH